MLPVDLMFVDPMLPLKLNWSWLDRVNPDPAVYVISVFVDEMVTSASPSHLVIVNPLVVSVKVTFVPLLK